MSRCHLNEHAFYELMPVVLRTEHVVLEGNRFFPLEMKIFARQVRECNARRLDTLVLSGCQVGRWHCSVFGSLVQWVWVTLDFYFPVGWWAEMQLPFSPRQVRIHSNFQKTAAKPT